MLRKLALALSAIGAAGLAFVWFVDGGAPEVPIGGGALSVVPRLEHWQLSATGDQQGGVVCTDRSACTRAKADELQAAGSACMWSGRVWLSAGSDRMMIRRDVKIEAYSVADRVNAKGQVIATDVATLIVPWDGGWWWRPEQERLTVSVPARCDTRELRVSLKVTARSLLGRGFSSLQPIGVKFWPVQQEGT